MLAYNYYLFFVILFIIQQQILGNIELIKDHEIISNPLVSNITTPNGIKCSSFLNIDERLACVQIIQIASMNPNNLIILLMSTNGGVELLQNWIRSAHYVGLTNFLVVCLDIELYQTLKQHGHKHSLILPKSIGYSSSSSIGDNVVSTKTNIATYKSKEWTSMMMMVPKLTKWVLQLGVNIVYCDTDIVLIRNPLSAFEQSLMTADFSAQVDGQVLPSSPTECDQKYSNSITWSKASRGGGKLCGGLFILSSDPKKHNMEIIDEWIQELDKKEGKNQPAFNRAIMKVQEKYHLHIQPLNCSLFPNGKWWRAAQPVPPLLVHANWVKEGKKELIQSWDLWYK